MFHTADEVAAQWGTPTYVYDLDAVADASTALAGAIPAGAVVYYSLKANPHVDLVRETRRLSHHAEVSSQGELDVALAAGHDGATILYTGPAKSEAELRAAVKRGVRRFSVESVNELARLDRVSGETGIGTECLLRMNSASARGHAGLRMTGAPSQFGIDLDWRAIKAADLRRRHVSVIGLHFFSLTNSTSETDLAEEFAAHIAEARRLGNLWGVRWRVLDLGGGFACPYARPGDRPLYPGLAAAVTAALDEAFRDHEIQVFFESGRYLVGASGQLITSVVDVKRSGEMWFVLLDSGINHLGGLSGVGRLLPARIVPSATPAAVESVATTVKLAGPLCTTADRLNGSVDLPLPNIGELQTVLNVGAYGLTASLLGFLSRPCPTELVVRAGTVVSASRLEIHRSAI